MSLKNLTRTASSASMVVGLTAVACGPGSTSTGRLSILFAVESLYMDQARRIAALTLGLELAPSSTPLTRLHSHRNLCFRVDAPSRPVVVKILVGEKLETRLVAQVQAQELAMAGGVPVPTVLAYDHWSAIAGRPAAYIVQAWVPGDDAERQIVAWSHAAREACAEQLGRVLATIHQIQGDTFVEGLAVEQRYREWPALFRERCARLLREVSQLQVVSPAMVAKLEPLIEHRAARLHLEQVDPRLTHRDLHLGNVIVDDGTICAIVDWESARFYDPLWDFARLELELLPAWPEMRQPLLSGYRKNRHWPTDAEERITLYLGTEYLAAVSFFAHRYPDRAKVEKFTELLLTWIGSQ